MAGAKKFYKLDIRVLEDDVALYSIAEDDAKVGVIAAFCEMYSIPLRPHVIKELTLRYEALKERLEENKSKVVKK